MPARALRPARSSLLARSGTAGARPLPALLVLVLALGGCTGNGSRPAASPESVPGSVPPPVRADVTLPPDPLVALVPTSQDVPAGLLPVVTGSGPRDLAAVAAFSADPAAAAAALRTHGFQRAYVAQYAEPGAQGRVLSVVVAQFATLPGAADDLAGDVAAGGAAERVDVGQGGSLASQPLPGGRGTLTTLRFRIGTRTWLLAYGAPEGGRDSVLDLGRTLGERAASA